jgi:asparagine synthase (glutamine-hydrolysing)
MCGICGIVNRHGTNAIVHLDNVRRMCQSMIHRGPDDEGVEVLNSACIGHRRLSIIDTSDLGKQPFLSEDKNLCLSANGEIYNFMSYRSELEQKGCRFKSQSDSEVILHGYRVDGVDVVDKLRGMFAFSIFDKSEQVLMLVRDRQGIKPLYYFIDDNYLIFASELQSIIKSGLVPTQLNPISLNQYVVYGVVPEPETLIQGIKVLLPGQRLLMNKGQIRLERYWQYPEPSNNIFSTETASLEVRQLLEESIRVHLQTDVPLGVFLSGGIDSTIVAKLSAKYSSNAIKTFSIGFEDGPEHLDERNIARRTAKLLKTDHQEVVLTAKDIKNNLEKIISSMNQPSFDGINSYFISKVTRDAGIKVALSGLGGDELFGGYETYNFLPTWGWIAKYWGKAPSQMKNSLLRILTIMVKSPVHKQKVLRLNLVKDFYGLYAAVRANGWGSKNFSLFSNDFLQRINVEIGEYDILSCLRESGEEKDHWRLTQKLEMKNYMGWRLLRDTDSMSMAHGLEVRVPLIDDKLVNYIMSMPQGWHKTSGWPKRLLVESMKQDIPDFVLNKPKQGFQLPMDVWLKGVLKPLVQDVFSKNNILDFGIFNESALNELYKQFQEGKLPYEVIWKFVVLELWMRHMKISY